MALLQYTQLNQNKGGVSTIQALQQGYFNTLKEACRVYDAPYSTARDRVSGRVTRQDLRSPNLKLTSIEESILIEWMLSMEERGLLPQANIIGQMANLLPQKQSNIDRDKLPMVSKC